MRLCGEIVQKLDAMVWPCFFYIFTAKLVILSQSIKLKTLNGHSSLRQPNTK